MLRQRTVGENKSWKIAKRIVLDLTFAEQTAEIAIMKTYSPTLEKFSSKMSLKQQIMKVTDPSLTPAS